MFHAQPKFFWLEEIPVTQILDPIVVMLESTNNNVRPKVAVGYQVMEHGAFSKAEQILANLISLHKEINLLKITSTQCTDIS